MTKLKLVLLALAVAGLSLGITACGGDDDDAGEAVTLDLTIGQLVPLTGDLAPFGPPGDKAANLAIDQIEAGIEEAGSDHTVNMLTEDSQTSDQAGVSAARKLVGEDASCINGAWASGVTEPVAESVTIRQGILQISPASTDPAIADLDDDGLVNRTAPSDAFQGPLVADVVELGLDGAEGLTVNVAARNDPYGNGLADSFTEGWEEKGGEVGETVIYDPDLPSYDSEADQIVSGNPDGWFFVDFPTPFDQVGAALVRTGDWDPERSFGPDGLAFPNLAEIVGRRVAEGMRVTVPGAEQSPQTEAFTDLYDEAPGPGTGPFIAQSFDATVLCYLSAVAAGSTDGTEMAAALPDVTNPPGDEFTFEDLGDAIQALQRGEDINYEGVSGPVNLDETGEPTGGVYGIFVFRGDDFEQVDQVPYGEEE